MSRRRPSGLKTVIRSITVIITEISSVKYGEHSQHALLNKAQIKQWQKVDLFTATDPKKRPNVNEPPPRALRELQNSIIQPIIVEITEISRAKYAQNSQHALLNKAQIE